MAQHLTLIHVQITIVWTKLTVREKLISHQEKFELKSTIQPELTTTCHHPTKIQRTERQKEEELQRTPKINLTNPNQIAIRKFYHRSKSSNKSGQVLQWIPLALNCAIKVKLNLEVQSHKASILAHKTFPSPKDRLISMTMFTAQMWLRSRLSNGRLNKIH